MNWISVKDRLPEKDLDEVLVCGQEKSDDGVFGEYRVHFASYSDGHFNSVYYYNYNEISTTHWMLLPELPTLSQRAREIDEQCMKSLESMSGIKGLLGPIKKDE